jgi:predicted O-linked N-acetylglucosamine transferase (SPINDLY family)
VRVVEDDINEMLKKYADKHIVLPSSVHMAVENLRNLQLDILVFGDVFMDSMASHLVMFRMAPIQILFWGHPVAVIIHTINNIKYP